GRNAVADDAGVPPAGRFTSGIAGRSAPGDHGRRGHGPGPCPALPEPLRRREPTDPCLWSDGEYDLQQLRAIDASGPDALVGADWAADPVDAAVRRRWRGSGGPGGCGRRTF